NAVKTGYWQLYRYNPDLVAERKNPFVLDSKAPTESLEDFLSGENRYASLAKADPETSRKLRDELAAQYERRYALYKQLADMPVPDAENK
ncbi:MAG: hypothetical protein K6F46_00505, partial [Desulfovibrio sp.]|nr:hypothetical protein [Desulfovibrio sp.]